MLEAEAVGSIAQRTVRCVLACHGAVVHLGIRAVDVIDTLYGNVGAVLCLHAASRAHTQHHAGGGAGTQVYLAGHDAVLQFKLGVVSPTAETSDSVLVGWTYILHLACKHHVVHSADAGIVVAIAQNAAHVDVSFYIQVHDEVLQEGVCTAKVTDETSLCSIAYSAFDGHVLDCSAAHIGEHAAVDAVGIYTQVQCVALSVECAVEGDGDAYHRAVASLASHIGAHIVGQDGRDGVVTVVHSLGKCAQCALVIDFEHAVSVHLQLSTVVAHPIDVVVFVYCSGSFGVGIGHSIVVRAVAVLVPVGIYLSVSAVGHRHLVFADGLEE